MPQSVQLPSDPGAAETFPQFVRACAQAYGGDIAVRFTGETLPDEELTFAELDRRSATLARGLLARGVGKGSRIGFIFGNGAAFAVVLAAIARIGAVAVPANPNVAYGEGACEPENA